MSRKKTRRSWWKAHGVQLAFLSVTLIMIAALAVFIIGKLTKPESHDIVAAQPEATFLVTPTPTPAPTPAPTQTPEPEPTPRVAVIRAAGDIMTHKLQLAIAKQRDGSYDFTPQFTYIAESLSKADYTIANLETTIGKYKDRDYSSYPFFNSPESLLTAIKGAGVDFLTLANNHMLDRYLAGLANTINNVEKAGFDYGGAYRTPEERRSANIVEVNGIKLGMLCYTQSTNGMEDDQDPKILKYAVPYLANANFAEDVRILKQAGAEVIIAMPHWGSEGKREPSSYQVKMAKKMVEAGVDVILGSHPHVVEPVYTLEYASAGEDKRDVLVAYSLGNLLCNMLARYTYAGVILEFTLVEKEDGSFAIENVGYVPTYIWREKRELYTMPIPVYYNDPPSGMDDYDIAQLRRSLKDITSVIGDDFELLIN